MGVVGVSCWFVSLRGELGRVEAEQLRIRQQADAAAKSLQLSVTSFLQQLDFYIQHPDNTTARIASDATGSCKNALDVKVFDPGVELLSKRDFLVRELDEVKDLLKPKLAVGQSQPEDALVAEMAQLNRRADTFQKKFADYTSAYQKSRQGKLEADRAFINNRKRDSVILSSILIYLCLQVLWNVYRAVIRPLKQLYFSSVRSINRHAPFQPMNSPEACSEIVSLASRLQELVSARDGEVALRTEELKKANEQLEASEHFTRATLDALRSAIVVLDERGVIISINRAANELALRHGFSSGEFAAGADFLRGFMNSRHAPPASAALVAGIREVMAGDRSDFMLEYDWHLPKQPQWFICRASRFKGEGPVRVVVSNLDNTPMKVLQDQHNRSQRMESLGTLAGGIAHDLNNALAPIMMGLEIVGANNPETEKMVDTMRTSGQRAASMVRQLLTFAKGAKGERVPLRVKDLILEIQKIMAGTLPKDIQLSVHTGADLVVRGDATQLHQVLLNLCVNARDAMPRGGRIEIREEFRAVDEIFAASMGQEAQAGRYAVVTVTDTGTGMTAEVMERMFEPFYTTKGPDKGTGLGLSTVLGIVKSHEGFVQVQSKVGAGTSFAVYLPVLEAARSVETQMIRKEGVVDSGNGETILLVDDEAPIREIGSAIMKRLGYHPVTAADGMEGLMKVAELRGELRAIITDLEMPKMNGVRFVQSLRHAMPDVPVIVASGSVTEEHKNKLAELRVVDFLNKPFTEKALGQMLEKVRDSLQSNSNSLEQISGPK